MKNKGTENIYSPEEDTFLLLRVIRKYATNKVLEIGTGSGLLALELEKKNRLVVGIDLDFNALNELRVSATKKQTGSQINIICCDSASPFRDEVFDLVVFNPPYLPSEEVNDNTIDGGPSGVEISKVWFKDASRILRKDGKIVFLSSSVSDVKGLFSYSRELGFEVNVLESKQLFFEELLVVEAKPIQSNTINLNQ
tara:strand:- start:41 stop:628 length:588 start_codon:yes stop_codon:yes gene_type:complete